MSDKQQTQEDNHKWTLDLILDKLTRRKKGSKGFKRAQQHRKNWINWSLNQLNFKNIEEVRLEDVSGIRFKQRYSRKMSHWTYTLIKDKLISLSETEGFSVVEQDNKYRSQRCNQCGFTHMKNRVKETFRCLHCDYTNCSDLNAALNHESDLIKVPDWVWKEKPNRKLGFFWNQDSIQPLQEPIVPVVSIKV